MPAQALDTLGIAHNLESAGIERAHAEAIATQFNGIASGQITRADLEPLATRAEVNAVKWVMGVQAALLLAISARLFGLF